MCLEALDIVIGFSNFNLMNTGWRFSTRREIDEWVNNGQAEEQIAKERMML